MAEKVEVLITGKNELSGVLDSVTKSLGGLDKLAFGLAAGGLAALGGALVATGAFMASAVGDAMEAQNVLAQLDSVLKSTGGAAGVTRDEITGLASELQKVTRFGDEAIISGENLLLTFTNIGKDVFPDATKIMLDMSQALGQDVKGSAIQLGKALNDPIKGITALSRVGVSFSEDQKKMIESLVQSGDLLGAQKVILQELQKEFGGSAEAAGKTFAGQLDILKNQLGEVKERIGGAVLPILQKFATFLLEKLADPRVQAFIDNLVARLSDLGATLGWVFEQLASGGDFGSIFQVFEDGSSVIGNILQIFGVSEDKAEEWGAKFRDAFNIVSQVFQTVATFIQEHGETIKNVMIGIGVALAAAGIISVITSIVGVIAAIANPVGLIVVAIGLLAAAWTGNWGGIRDKVMAAWEAIRPVLEKLWEWLEINIPLALQFLSSLWTGTLLPALQAIWSFLQTNVFPIFNAIANVVGAALSLAFRALFGYIQNVAIPVLKVVWDWFNAKIMPIIRTVAAFLTEKLRPAFSGVSTAVQGVVDWLGKLAGKINNIKLPDWLTPGSPTPFELGLRGIADAMKSVGNLTGDVSLPSMIPGGTSSPFGTTLGATSAFAGPTSGGMVVNVNVEYKPIVSTASQADVERLMPYIREGALRTLKDLKR